MSIGSLADDERLKMVLPQACCYCGSRDYLSVDHLIPTKRGGANTGDNLVWACRSCNSSKCARDALEWLVEKNQFPPILLLRRYLKLAIEMSRERNLMDIPLAEAPELPFSFSAIPQAFLRKIGSDTILHAFSPFHASAMHHGFLRLRGFCALSPVAQAAAFRPAAVSPARPVGSTLGVPTFSRCGISCVLFNPRPTRRSSGPAPKTAQPA
jgi:hypothetical protein